jgi:hypothetical protein
MSSPDARRQFDELLPWFLSGTLTESDRDWVEHYLREHPEAEAEVRWTQTLQGCVRESVQVVPPELGLDELLRRIRTKNTTKGKPAGGPGWFGRLSQFFTTLRFTPASALVAAVILVQAGIIGGLVHELYQFKPESLGSAAFRSYPGWPSTAAGPLLRITFKSDATESDLRNLLLQIGGSIVSGPSQLGDYLVEVETPALDEVSKKVAASPVVESVTIVTHPPSQ